MVRPQGIGGDEVNIGVPGEKDCLQGSSLRQFLEAGIPPADPPVVDRFAFTMGFKNQAHLFACILVQGEAALQPCPVFGFIARINQSLKCKVADAPGIQHPDRKSYRRSNALPHG